MKFDVPLSWSVEMAIDVIDFIESIKWTIWDYYGDEIVEYLQALDDRQNDPNQQLDLF